MLAESIKGKSVIVTGGSKGIGKGIARVFAEHGAKVLIVARDGATAEAAAAEFAKAGHVASSIAADVSDEGATIAMARAAAERHGGIDVLCANAGVFPMVRIEEMTTAQWDEVQAINLKGTFLSVQACLPYLKKSTQGRIVLTSSITGPYTSTPGFGHYGASKAGQLGFMRAACLEFAKYGITVNAVLPGNIMTEGGAAMGEDYWRAAKAAIPLGRLGAVEDLGYAALFLATREAGYITGQTIVVDGGQLVPESKEATP